MIKDYRVKIEVFEGPIDLLLYLIRKNHFDIFDIPIASITDQYLQYLEIIENLNLDIAGEFIMMAATLMEIKSRMLLPREEEKTVDEIDPRSQLVQRLLEYQRYKDAAERLTQMNQLGWHTFTRKGIADEPQESDEVIEVSLFEILDAFKKVLQKFPAEKVQEISRDRITVAHKINDLIEKLRNVNAIRFEELLMEKSLQDLIATFLALLELMRLKLLRVAQTDQFQTIWVYPTERIKNGFEFSDGSIDGYG